MKKKWFDIFSACLTGIGIGVPITITCMILLGGFNGAVREFLIWTVASALFGVLSLVIFQMPNDLSLPTATLLHCAGCLVVAAGAGALCGYAENFGELLLAMLPVFLVIYGILYLSTYKAMKAEARRINEELEKK